MYVYICISLVLRDTFRRKIVVSTKLTMTLGLLKLPTQRWGGNGYYLRGTYLLIIDDILQKQLKGEGRSCKGGNKRGY